ncbi:hypothetical protein [Streptomyces sp. NPDC048419]|uniref:hypothetical protein n=1 Tax=Streptomyces sp. NPDC048419 TaxID=3365547 RepID=UPI00371F1E99
MADLVWLTKARWRIEHDYPRTQQGLGLDHFEGRSWPDWHHRLQLTDAYDRGTLGFLS